MTFSKFAGYLQKLERTSSRNQMMEILAKLLGEADRSEIDKICYLSLGRLTPSYEPLEFNMAGKTMLRVLAQAYDIPIAEVKKSYQREGDLGLVAEKMMSKKSQTKKGKVLTVGAVFQRLYEVAVLAGTGSQEGKIGALARLILEVEPLAVRYLVRLPLGQLRLGFSEATLIEGLAFLLRGDKSAAAEIKTKFNICPDIGLIARTLKHGGRRGILSARHSISPGAGRPPPRPGL